MVFPFLGINMEIKQEEMKSVNGGSITSSMINAISKVVQTIYDLGKSTGSAIRRIVTKNYCPAK